MQYHLATKEELIDSLKKKEAIIDDLTRKVQELELLECPRMVNLGQWHWNLDTNDYSCNELKLRHLGYDMPKVLTYDFFADKLHWEDFSRVMETANKHIRGVLPVYEVEYRIRAQNGRWKWFYEKGRLVVNEEKVEGRVIEGSVFDITKIKMMEIEFELNKEKLMELITIDELTKLYNRKAVFAKLEQDILRSRRYGLYLSVLLLNIDDFNEVNERHGQYVGDDALIQMGKFLKMSIRKVDYLGRCGGDEFMLVFPNCKLEDAKKVASRICKNLAIYFSAIGLKITVSGGLKEYIESSKNKKEQSVDEFVSDLEKLMQTAKKAGKDKIVY